MSNICDIKAWTKKSLREIEEIGIALYADAVIYSLNKPVKFIELPQQIYIENVEYTLEVSNENKHYVLDDQTLISIIPKQLQSSSTLYMIIKNTSYILIKNEEKFYWYDPNGVDIVKIVNDPNDPDSLSANNLNAVTSTTNISESITILGAAITENISNATTASNTPGTKNVTNTTTSLNAAGTTKIITNTANNLVITAAAANSANTNMASSNVTTNNKRLVSNMGSPNAVVAVADGNKEIKSSVCCFNSMELLTKHILKLGPILQSTTFSVLFVKCLKS